MQNKKVGCRLVSLILESACKKAAPRRNVADSRTKARWHSSLGRRPGDAINRQLAEQRAEIRSQSMRKRGTSILIAVLAVASLSAQQKRGPSTPQERAKAVQFARDLENNPLGPQAKSEREWLLRWVMEVPDIAVAFCPQILGTELSDKQPYGTEIRTQLMFSQAAFLIENPDKFKDDLAIQTAGVNGSLKVYERTLKDHPNARSKTLDELIARRANGTLQSYLQEAMEQCKKRTSP
jgi:hypothetical protein